MNAKKIRIDTKPKFFLQLKNNIPLTLFVLAIMSYGLLMHRLGFYWDDFPYLYLNHSQGIGGYPAYMASDRPFSAWFFMLEGFLFGKNPFGYHLFALILRWASAYVFYLILSKIFLAARYQNFIAATLFLLYPGFLQQSIAIIYSLHFTVLLLFLLSVLFMILSLENQPHHFHYSLLSLACSMGILASEYFAFLELIRPAIIWLFYNRQKPSSSISLKRIWIAWLPYFVIFFSFLIWRVFIFQFPTYSLDLLNIFKENIPYGISYLFSRILRDSFTVMIKAWLPVFSFEAFKNNVNNRTLLLLLVSIVSGVLVWHQGHQAIHKNPPVQNPINKTMICAGIYLTLLAGIPIWATDLPVKLEFAWDRLTLPFSLGVSMFITGLLFSIIKKPAFLFLIFSLVVGLSAGFHLDDSYQYLDEWNLLQDFFRQLTLRAPGIKEGTTLLTDNFPLRYYSDNSLTAPLNWIYDADNHSLDLNYMFYLLDVRLGRRLPALEKGLDINQPYRSFSFNGNTNQIIFLQYDPPACVHLFNDSSNIPIYNLSDSLQMAANLSDLDLITHQQDFSFPSFFASDTNENWCSYFERADFARQRADWKEVIQLFQDAKAKNLEPTDPGEFFPFLEAFLQVLDFNSAMKISKQILEQSIGMEKNICVVWKQFMQKIPYEDAAETVAQFYYSELKCMQ